MPNEQNKVAIVFADISKSTRLFDEHGDERAWALVAHTLGLLSGITEEYEGRVVKTIGDEVMCTFDRLDQAIEATIRMPAAIQDDPELSPLNLQIHVGLHYGVVIHEDGDVYGDAVNVAARMAKVARPDQIITTRETVSELPPYQQSTVRSLGMVSVDGKNEDIEVCEILWQSDMNDLTIMHGQVRITNVTPSAELTLLYNERQYSINKNKGPFLMGRGDRNDLVVKDQSVSRTHASIEFRQGKFVLIDRSTNGTFLQILKGEKVFLHREQMPLRQEGVIMLGQDTDEAGVEPISFKCL